MTGETLDHPCYQVHLCPAASALILRDFPARGMADNLVAYLHSRGLLLEVQTILLRVPPGPPGQGQVDPNFARPYDSQIPHPITVPPNMPLDRRLSVPDTMPSASTSRPERVLRSRSRPPSRSTAAGRAAGEMPPGVLDAATAGSESKTDESPIPRPQRTRRCTTEERLTLVRQNCEFRTSWRSARGARK